MAILQGSTYKLPIVIRDSLGNVIKSEDVEKASFTFGSITKKYEEGGEVYYDNEINAWIIPLNEKETFSLRGIINWQARIQFTNGTIDGTLPKKEEIYSSIDRTILTEGENNA